MQIEKSDGLIFGLWSLVFVVWLLSSAFCRRFLPDLCNLRNLWMISSVDRTD
jgi:hypothetical protein